MNQTIDRKYTYDELVILAEEAAIEKKRVDLSIQLNICPECGAKIIEENVEILDKPIKLFGIILKSHNIWDYRKVCSVNKAHYEDKCNYVDW